ncbi:MAG: YggS family pyridoxal phosphate-dependent enzyme [Phycisphaerales bacterium]|nr:YggS family pyridoxal phosphate-dependent enzyme [Phycisphaerales bacterium]
MTKTTAVKRRLIENQKRIQERIEKACARAHRDPSEVRLVAVAKYVELDVIRQALDLGILDIGESRAQQLNQRAGMVHEFIERKSVLSGRREMAARPRWHMVGHLQRNKIKLVVPWVELIHSVDNLRLAEELHDQATKVGRVVDVLLQVNTSGEKSKFGVAVGAVPHLAEHFSEWSGVRLCGLMTMAPAEVSPVELRLYFERLRDIFEDLRGERVAGSHFKELSMGMSSDFETAVESGATIVRIGSLLFEGLTGAAATPAAAGGDV